MSQRDRVTVSKDGKERHGFIVEAQRDYGLWSGLSQGEPPIIAVRVWLDGDAQPELEMRPSSSVTRQ
jgi:hypothetical protein